RGRLPQQLPPRPPRRTRRDDRTCGGAGDDPGPAGAALTDAPREPPDGASRGAASAYTGLGCHALEEAAMIAWLLAATLAASSASPAASPAASADPSPPAPSAAPAGAGPQVAPAPEVVPLPEQVMELPPALLAALQTSVIDRSPRGLGRLERLVDFMYQPEGLNVHY